MAKYMHVAYLKVCVFVCVCVTFEEIDLCVKGVPAQCVKHQRDGAVLFESGCIRSALVVQDDGRVEARDQSTLHLLIPGQDLVQRHGALRSPAHDGVAADVHCAPDVTGAERQEGAAVQHQAPRRSLLLQQPLQHSALHFTQLLHPNRVVVAVVEVIPRTCTDVLCCFFFFSTPLFLSLCLSSFRNKRGKQNPGLVFSASSAHLSSREHYYHRRTSSFRFYEWASSLP